MDSGKVIKGALLIAGTSIGGGMLALPVESALGGFVPSIFIYLVCWMLMASTGLLFLEVSLWMGGESNIISMAQRTLGWAGQLFAWMLYLFLFYALTVAYISGCGDLLVQIFPDIVPKESGALLFVLFYAPFVYAGAVVVGRINSFFMIGLGVCYFIFVYLGIPHVKIHLLERRDWFLSLMGLPVAFTAFAYQGTVPTLIHYLDHDPKSARWAILVGSAIPFFAYLIWQALILGIVPVEGPGGLAEALANGDNAVHPLRLFINNASIYHVGQFFAFFAMVTSFFGVTLGLKDFLADGLKVKQTALGRFFLCLLVFLPPLVIALVNKNIFLAALGVAGGFGCATLLGLLPIAMVWMGRYHLKLEGPYAFSGGKSVLVLLAVLIFFEIFVQISLMAGWIGPV